MKEELYITYESILKVDSNFDLDECLKQNLDKDFLVSNENVIYIKKDYLDDFTKNLDGLNFFRLKGYPSSSKTLIGYEINMEKDHIFRNAKEYNKDLKTIKNINKLYNNSKGLISYYKNKSTDFFNKKVLCFDIEAYENDQTKITEVGLTILNGMGIKTEHYIVKEHIDLRNGKYVEDNKDNFLFGESKIDSLDNILKVLKKELAENEIVLGHGIKNDFKFLSKVSDITPNNLILIDTYKLSKMINLNGFGVKSMLEYFNIEYKSLHNAGNDSYFNVKMAAQFFQSFDLEKFKKDIGAFNEKYNEEMDTFNEKWKNPVIDIDLDLDLN